MKFFNTYLIILLMFFLSPIFQTEIASAGESLSIQHSIAAKQTGKFYGWPANNGVWQWGNEILVGFTEGEFKFRSGHNIGGKQKNVLSRSLDGGETWKQYDPEGFMDDENQKYLAKNSTALKKPINFLNPDLAIRFMGEGYHGNDVPAGGFFYSVDRGKKWKGPFTFNGLNDHPEIKGKMLSPRTDYLVQGEKSCLVFLSSRNGDATQRRIGCIETTDGGLTFQFVSWVTPQLDKGRGIMSQTIQLSENELLLSYRKLNFGSEITGEIETYFSNDKGRSWKFRSNVKQMTVSSNPPALVKLKDGRICCVYGDRSMGEIRGRYSRNNGKTWGPEFIVRDDYYHTPGDVENEKPDMGYVRLVQRPDGKLVAMYYWTNKKNQHSHIAVSIWKP